MLLLPGFVVMDMKELDSGLVATKRILEEVPNARIIILTVHEEEDLVLRALAEGAVDYVIKEPDCSNLIEHIRKAFQDRIIFDSEINKVLHNEYRKLKSEQDQKSQLYATLLQLTPSEREIIKLLLENKKISEIAHIRFVETITIKKQVTNILRKFSMARTKEIVSLIRENNAENLFYL